MYTCALQRIQALVNIMLKWIRPLLVSLNRPLSVVLALSTCLISTMNVQAATPIIPPAPTIDATSYLLMDATSGKVLVEQNSHEWVPPASLTKIMTAYVAEQEIEAGRLSEDDEVLVSVRAWRTGGSKMFIREGTSVSVGDLLRGIIIQSGNDASIALAEHIAGSEEAFASMMNQQAAVLGMNDTQFKNATGLPAEDHYSSAWDLATLTIDLIERYPEHYAVYSERSFSYNDIDQPNRNRLLWRDKSVDGVKTGFTNAAGYCLVASAVRQGMRLVSVVLGTQSDEARMRESQKLLSYGFRYFETQTLYDTDVALKEQEIFYGEIDALNLGVAEPVVVTFPRGYYKSIEVDFELPRLLEAPINLGQEVGVMRLRLAGETIYEAPLVAQEAVPEAGMFSRLGDFIYLFFDGLFGE